MIGKEPKMPLESIINTAIRGPSGTIYQKGVGSVGHDNLRDYFPEIQKGAGVEGFLTNTGRFVSREEAAQIAYKAGQTKELLDTLNSPDIFDLR